MLPGSGRKPLLVTTPILALAVGQGPKRGQHLPVLLPDKRGELGGRGVGDGLAGTPLGPEPAAQLVPAAVDRRGPQVGRRLAGVGQVSPSPVEAGERLLDDVLGGGPVAEHDQGQPDQADRMPPVQPGDCRRGVGRGRPRDGARPATRPGRGGPGGKHVAARGRVRDISFHV